MIPLPGETPGAWWGNTGSQQARDAAAERGGYGTDFDLPVYFLHDVPPEVVTSGEGQQYPESDAVFGSVCDFRAWPAVPIRVAVGADDRFFPAAFQQQVARDRLGIEADVLPGGHLIALAQPARSRTTCWPAEPPHPAPYRRAADQHLVCRSIFC